MRSPALIPRLSNIFDPTLSKIIIFLWWTIRSSPSPRTLENQPPDSVIWSIIATLIACSQRSASHKSSNLVKNRPRRNNQTARMMGTCEWNPHLPKQKWVMHKRYITLSGVIQTLIRRIQLMCQRSPALWRTVWVKTVVIRVAAVTWIRSSCNSPRTPIPNKVIVSTRPPTFRAFRASPASTAPL